MSYEVDNKSQIVYFCLARQVLYTQGSNQLMNTAF